MLEFAQYALQVQDHRLQGIVEVITNSSVFIPMLGFQETGDAFAYTYNRQATLGGIAFRGLNTTYTADTGVINPVTETLRIFGGMVETDRQLAKGARGRSVRANNIAMKVKRAGLFFDSHVIKGNSAENPLQFDGLRVRLTGKQVITAGANGANLTLAMIDKALDAVVGENGKKVIVCNLAVRTVIKQLVTTSAGGAAVADFKNGEIDRYNGARIQVIDEDGDEQAVLGFDETQGTDAETTSLYVVRPGSMDGEMLRGLVRRPEGGEPIEYVDYGERGGVYQELVESVMGIALHHPRCASRLKGIKRPA